eukprot:4796017-Pleurochrysis_carterae.AAC.2
MLAHAGLQLWREVANGGEDGRDVDDVVVAVWVVDEDAGPVGVGFKIVISRACLQQSSCQCLHKFSFSTHSDSRAQYESHLLLLHVADARIVSWSTSL